MLKKVWFAAIFLLGSAFAQPLADLLPAETFFALGARNLSGEEARIQPFIDEFNRLELGAALTKVFEPQATEDTTSAETGSADAGSTDTSSTDAGSTETGSTEPAPMTAALPEELKGIGPLDLMGNEAWISLSISRFNPLPVLTLISQLSDKAAAQFDTALTKALSGEGIETETEGSMTFYQQLITSEKAPPIPLVFAKEGNLLMLSTHPDTMRGVLRQLQGSKDPSFADTEAYQKTLAKLEGNFMGYLDYAQLPAALSTYTKGLGFDKLVSRLTEAFETAGVSAGVLRLTDAGMESEGLQAYDPMGKDKELLALLKADTKADEQVLRFYSKDALSFSAGSVNLAGWWNYLNGISESTPELGGSLDELLQAFTGINLQETVFNWTGDQFASMTTKVAEVAAPGVAATNLLGDQVFMIQAKDEQKAAEGLSQLFSSASQGIAAFADPSGGAGSAKTETQEVNGITVTSYEITSGVKLSYAITKGYVLIATSDDALATALNASGEAGFAASLPELATSYSVTDNQRSVRASAQQMISQLQLAAGFGGASNLNFDAVDEASQKLETFVQFIAERLGTSTSYSEQHAEGIYSFSQSEIAW